MTPYVPTSVVLEDLFERAPSDVTPAWLIANLRERSFGIVMLLMALIGLVPGASGIVGILLAFPALQMMLAHEKPVLPRLIAERRLPASKVRRIGGRLVPLLRRLEVVIRPRWPTPFETTKRIVGLVVLLLAATLVWPFPFSHIIPALVIMLLSLAYLEEDGVLLCIALLAALVSLSVTGATVWAAIRTTGWLERWL
jgi:hypothetical protein